MHEATIPYGQTTLTARVYDEPSEAHIYIGSEWHGTTEWDGETLRPNIRGRDHVELAFADLSAALAKSS